MAGGSEETARSLAARAGGEGPDVLWDDPRLASLLITARAIAVPSPALFHYVVLRRLLLELGVADRAVTDYCATLVLAFGAKDRAFRLSEHDENRYDYLVDLVEEAGRAEGERRFRVHVHLGNFSLWMAGIFPDYIAARRARKGGPDLGYYEQIGRNGFLTASDDRLADRYGLSPVLREVGERFALFRTALNRLSDLLFFPHYHSPDKLLRQVAEALRFGAVQ